MRDRSFHARHLCPSAQHSPTFRGSAWGEKPFCRGQRSLTGRTRGRRTNGVSLIKQTGEFPNSRSGVAPNATWHAAAFLPVVASHISEGHDGTASQPAGMKQRSGALLNHGCVVMNPAGAISDPVLQQSSLLVHLNLTTSFFFFFLKLRWAAVSVCLGECVEPEGPWCTALPRQEVCSASPLHSVHLGFWGVFCMCAIALNLWHIPVFPRRPSSEPMSHLSINHLVPVRCRGEKPILWL